MADELELIELEELQNKSLNSGDGSKSTLWFPVFPEAIGGKVQKCLRFKPVGHFRYLQMPGVLAMARKTTIPREKKNAGWKTSCSDFPSKFQARGLDPTRGLDPPWTNIPNSQQWQQRTNQQATNHHDASPPKKTRQRCRITTKLKWCARVRTASGIIPYENGEFAWSPVAKKGDIHLWVFVVPKNAKCMNNLHKWNYRSHAFWVN